MKNIGLNEEKNNNNLEFNEILENIIQRNMSSKSNVAFDVDQATFEFTNKIKDNECHWLMNGGLIMRFT